MNALGEWSISNHLSLSIDKCACFHYEHNNPGYMYNINELIIKTVDQCSDLGVLHTSDFRYNAHIDMICLKASRLSGIVAKLFTCGGCEFQTLVLPNIYVHPCLECAPADWSPINVGTSDQLEKIQRRFMRKLFGSQLPVYEARLNILGLPSLSMRRKAADLVLTFKLLHNLIDFDP